MKRHSTDFNSYTLPDFLDNEDFINWVLNPDDAALITYWQEVETAYPQLSATIKQAKQLFLSLNFPQERMDQQELDQLWQRIRESVAGKTAVRTIPLWFRSAAAAVIAGVLLSTAFYFYRNRQRADTTAYGQVKTIILPDSSVVTLNANSNLHYAANWNAHQLREVWIDGEAFFKIKHLHQSGPIKAAERFVVHAHNVNIEVLGTTFNVNDRRDLVNVSLITGKISLRIKSSNKPAIMMKPGDIVQYSSTKRIILRKTRDTAGYISWENGKLHFNEVPVTEVFKYIEDVYGYKVIIKGPDLRGRKLSGVFAGKDEGTLFKMLSVVLNVSVQKDEASGQLIVTDNR